MLLMLILVSAGNKFIAYVGITVQEANLNFKPFQNQLNNRQSYSVDIVCNAKSLTIPQCYAGTIRSLELQLRSIIILVLSQKWPSQPLVTVATNLVTCITDHANDLHFLVDMEVKVSAIPPLASDYNQHKDALKSVDYQ